MSAFLWGLVASSSLLIGAAIALTRRIPTRTLGIVMAFGSGTLLSAVAYDLVAEAFVTSGAAGIPAGMALGSVTFFLGDLAIDRAGGSKRKTSTPDPTGSAKAIVLGTILDGIPESLVLGLSLLSGEGISVAVLVAIWVSNLPEAISASTGLREGGASPAQIYGLWALVALASATSAWAGYTLLADAAPATVAFIQSFAAGALLTMLADVMMPEAYRHGGPVVGIATTFGYLFAFGLASWERTVA